MTHPQEVHLKVSPTSILILACNELTLPDEWLALTALAFCDSVIVTANGPLHPKRRQGGIGVSAYATKALYAALGQSGLRDVSGQIPAPAGSQAAVKHAERILVVEDDPVSRTLIQSQLVALGYDRVDVVSNGRQAMERCRTETYDVIVSDLNMPVMDGKMLLSMLRANGISTPVIVNTASTEQDIDANHGDFAYVLHKPVGIGQLGDALAHVRVGMDKPHDVATQSFRDETLVKQLQAAFLASWEVDVDAMKRAVLDGDDKTFQRRLHRLKGALLVMQEHDAATQCESLQLRVKANGCSAVGDLLPRFWTTIQDIVDRYQVQSLR